MASSHLGPRSLLLLASRCQLQLLLSASILPIRDLMQQNPRHLSSLSSRLPPGLPDPPAQSGTIQSACFVKSSTALEHMPFEVGPELAFIGHSNTGKSSLINTLTGRPGLALVSKQPGEPDPQACSSTSCGLS